MLFYAGVGAGPLFVGWMYDLNGDYVAALLVAIPVLAAGAALIASLARTP
ncbi:MAG: hypothetical protein SFV21_00865 [Rhodospirillaceae bacterium]|nr:hypothetical protein [Rhodospirillaceae bacterium]